MHEHGTGHGAHGGEPSDKLPAFIAATLSVFLALVSLGSHRSHTQAVLMQAKAADQWAYYQASRVKLHMQEVGAQLLSQSTAGDEAEVKEYPQSFKDKIDEYEKKSRKIQTDAEELEAKVHEAEHRANYFDIGEIFLEISIVLCSLTFLTKRSLFWKAATVGGLIGLGIAAMSFFVGH